MTPADFEASAAEYMRTAARAAFPWVLRPMLDDDCKPAGAWDIHYGPMDLWAARKIVGDHPTKAIHTDVGSRIDGFVTHLLASRADVTYVDMRPLDIRVGGLTFRRDDASTLATFEDNSVDSLSCLHVAEHIGLGRYGDAIDPDGWLKCCRSLARVLAPGGRLYFAVPVGRQRVEFNAHRVFAAKTVREAFSDLDVVSFAGVDDAGHFSDGFDPDWLSTQNYACGMWELTKP